MIKKGRTDLRQMRRPAPWLRKSNAIASDARCLHIPEAILEFRVLVCQPGSISFSNHVLCAMKQECVVPDFPPYLREFIDDSGRTKNEILIMNNVIKSTAAAKYFFKGMEFLVDQAVLVCIRFREKAVIVIYRVA